MRSLSHPMIGGTMIAMLAAGLAVGTPGQAWAATGVSVLKGKPAPRRIAPVLGTPGGAEQPGAAMNVSVGRGTLITLPSPMTDVFIADEKVADVQVRSATQLWVFGRGAGETSVYAVGRGGAVLWSRQVRVGTNMESVGEMLRVAMPEASITATPMTGALLLTGTVSSPDDVAEATRLAQAFVGDKTMILTRLRAPTPLQVNLHVKIVEVSRSVSKVIGVNLLSADASSGFQFGIGQGRAFSPQYTPGGPLGVGVTTGSPGTTIVDSIAGGSTLGFAGKLLGLDLLSSLDLAETDGLATTLAEPNLTALSGETASFLAGGEIPIPQSQGLGSVSVEFKQYGVSLAFTPVVMSDGRISLRVRPEVSQLSDSGAVKLNGFTIPALTTRRAETTVELGSGQSFMIGGLIQTSHNNTTDKAPVLGDLPVLGALFRSNSFRKQETELVIVVTPYLVRPVDATAIRLPTDGYRAASDATRVLTGRPASSSKPPAAPPAAAPVAPAAAAGGIAPGSTAAAAPTPAPAPGFSL